MIDSHCHLADEIFAADLEAVIGRAKDAGLERTLVVLEGGNEAGGPFALSDLYDSVAAQPARPVSLDDLVAPPEPIAVTVAAPERESEPGPPPAAEPPADVIESTTDLVEPVPELVEPAAKLAGAAPVETAQAKGPARMPPVLVREVPDAAARRPHVRSQDVTKCDGRARRRRPVERKPRLRRCFELLERAGVARAGNDDR